MDYSTKSQKYTPLDIMDILPTPEYPFADDKWDEKNHDFMMNGWIARKQKKSQYISHKNNQYDDKPRHSNAKPVDKRRLRKKERNNLKNNIDLREKHFNL